MLKRLHWIISTVLALALLHLWISSEQVTISIPSPDRRLIGQVTAAREFPYLSIYSLLVIRDGITGEVVRRHPLIVRDTFSDIVSEVHSLGWSGASLKLDIDRSHYAGPT